jgi:hypothetical protein
MYRRGVIWWIVGGDAGANLTGKGPITYVQGKDNSNVVRPLIENGTQHT